MHRRPSVLAYRPKTSGAIDEDTTGHANNNNNTMKRTASQTFTTSHYPDGSVVLDAVSEGSMAADCAASHYSHSSSLSRAIGAVTGSFTRTKSRRRLSSLSAASSSGPSRRRASLQSLFTLESFPPLPTTTQNNTHRVCLQHHDSGIPSSSEPQGAKPAFFRRMRSIRGKPDEPNKTPVLTFPQNPIPAVKSVPGAAARQAAAAAREDRSRREQQQPEHTQFIKGILYTSARDGELKDNESGIDMSFASAMVRTDSVASKASRDPFERLPYEVATAVLSNLDAKSLLRAESVSRGWNKLASEPHVWRDVFLRQFTPSVHVSPAPIQMGGAGIGKQRTDGRWAPGQEWKRMYRARMQINKRWRLSKPAAIYMNGHTDSVYCCQFDEEKAITGSRDRTIRVWDLRTYTCVKVYGGPSHMPVAGTPPPLEERPERVVSNPSLNGDSRGNQMYVVPSDYHDASILCLQYDKEIMVTGSSDYTCIVWDITGAEYKPIRRLHGHEAGVLDVCLDDKHIISCSKDATIKVWDRATGECLRTLQGHRGPVNAVQLRGNRLVSASGDGVAKLWDLDTGRSIKDFPSEDRGLAAVEFSDDARYVLAGGNDHVVYKFDARTGNLVHSCVRHEGLVRSLFLDAHNGRIISGSYDQSIQVSDYRTGQRYGLYKNWTTSWILSAKSDYRRVVATSQDGRILILDFGYEVQGREMLAGVDMFGVGM